MAHYSYKDVAYRGDFADTVKDWEAKTGRTYEGTADYDGDIYEVAGFLLDKKDVEIAALQARVRELEGVIKTAWENSVPWGEYVGEESGKHMRIIHISDEAYQALHGIGYDLYQQSLKGTP